MKSTKFYFIFLTAILAGIYWQWFLPGPKVANDFPLVSGENLRSMLDFPMIWLDRAGEGLGFNAIFSLWSYPTSLIMGLLSNLNLSFEILERIFFIIPFIFLGAFSIGEFLKHFRISDQARFLCSIFYLANTYIILLIDGGQLLIVLAYAFFPLCFLAIEKAIDANFYRKVFVSLTVVLLGFFDIRFIFVLLLLLILRFLYGLFHQRQKVLWIKQWITMGLISSVMLLGFNAFWIIPYFLFPPNQESFARLTQMTDGVMANIGHSLLIISPHWYKNVFGNISPLRFEFILLPIFAFLAPLVRRRDYWVGFWLLIALFSIFLSKGSAEPFSKAYTFLFFNVPGFSLFRDSTKFFFLTTLSYTFLIGVSLDWIFSKFKSKKLKIAVIMVCMSYLLFLIWPILLNQMTGTLSTQRKSQEFREIADALGGDTTFSRSFWIPSTLPLSYSTPTHPIVEALRLSEKRPFASGIKGTYEIFNFLREAPYVGEVFDVAGIGYIVYPFPDRQNLHPDEVKYYNTFWDQLTKLSWLEELPGGLPILKVKDHQDKFFLPDNIWWVIGSDEILNEATKSAKLSLRNNALIFSEEKAGLGERLEEFPSSNIVLYKKTKTDLAGSLIDTQNLIFPAKGLSKDPDSSGWWKREAKDLIRWRYFLKTKYGIDNQDFDLGGGWAVGEGSLKLKVKSLKLKVGEMLLARVMESSRSGNLYFYQGGQLIGKIQTKTGKEANVRWFEVGKITGDAGLEVVSDGDINVINALAILPKEVWKEYLDKVNAFKSDGRIKDFIPENTEPKNAEITYKEIDPAIYEVTIKGLKKEAIVIFSSSFDNLWQMRNTASLPIYSLLNGFKVDKDGTYEIIFEPQKQVLPGLFVSLVVLVSVTGFLILKKK